MGNYFISLIIIQCHPRRRRPLETLVKEKRFSRTCALFATISTVTTPAQTSRVLSAVTPPPRKDLPTPALFRPSRERPGRKELSTSTSSHPQTTHLATRWLSPVLPTPRTEVM